MSLNLQTCPPAQGTSEPISHWLKDNIHSLWHLNVAVVYCIALLNAPRKNSQPVLAFLSTCRNPMSARYQGAQSATQTPVLSGSTWKRCMVLKRMSPRSSVETSIPGTHPRETKAAILRQDPQATRLRARLVSKKTSATLPQSVKNASKWKRSSPRSPWYATSCAFSPSPFPFQGVHSLWNTATLKPLVAFLYNNLLRMEINYIWQL